MIIGITGKIGSGKSTVTKIFVSLGWKVIDADKIGRLVVDKNKSILKKLVASFGKEILTKSEKLNRKKLRELAFKNKSSVKTLNNIVHPYLVEEIYNQIEKYKKQKKNIVLDAALLYDWKIEKKLDAVIVVHTNQKLRIHRMKQRGYSNEQIKEIDNRQRTFQSFRKKSDYLIYNSGTQKELVQKVKKVLQKLTT